MFIVNTHERTMQAYKLKKLFYFIIIDLWMAQLNFTGATNYVGAGTGSVLAGFITDIFSWQYYFYYSGICYFLGFILAIVFLHESPKKCWFIMQNCPCSKFDALANIAL